MASIRLGLNKRVLSRLCRSVGQGQWFVVTVGVNRPNPTVVNEAAGHVPIPAGRPTVEPEVIRVSCTSGLNNGLVESDEVVEGIHNGSLGGPVVCGEPLIWFSHVFGK